MRGALIGHKGNIALQDRLCVADDVACLPRCCRASSARRWLGLCMQVMSKRGVDIAYIGGGSSVIAAGGFNAEGGNVALWDTTAPLSGGPIAALDHHSSLVTALQVTRGNA